MINNLSLYSSIEKIYTPRFNILNMDAIKIWTDNNEFRKKLLECLLDLTKDSKYHYGTFYIIGVRDVCNKLNEYFKLPESKFSELEKRVGVHLSQLKFLKVTREGRRHIIFTKEELEQKLMDMKNEKRK
jgi:hypothetical protein